MRTQLLSFDAELRRDFWEAVAVIDRSGLGDDLDRELRPRRGPQSRLTFRALLVAGVLVAVRRDGSLDVRSMWRTLNGLPDDLLAELRLRRRDDGQTVSEVQVSHCWNRLAESLDAATTYAGRRIGKPSEDDAARAWRRGLEDPATRPRRQRSPSTRGTARDLQAEDRADRAFRLSRVCDQLLQATLPDGFDSLTIAIDWTDHETWATTYTGRATSADPDARWGRRRPSGNRVARRQPVPPDVNHDPADWDEGKSELFYGFNQHVAVTTRATDGTDTPEVALAIRVTPADAMDVGPVVVDMVRSIQGAQVAVEEVLVDRGYSTKSVDKIHRPLAGRDTFLTFDYTLAQYGRHGTHEGAVLIGGEPHCPAMPEELANGPRPSPIGSTEAAWASYWENRSRLDSYAFRRLGRPTTDLTQRYECPAAAGRVRCPLRVTSQSIALDKNVPEVFEPPTDPLRCCTQRTITFPTDVGLGLRQRHPHGSKSWLASYDRRTAVERYFSSVKYEGGAQRHDIRVLGLTRRTLMLTFACVGTNLRHIRNWTERIERSVPRPLASVTTVADTLPTKKAA